MTTVPNCTTEVRDFLKRYSTVPNTFIDEFLSVYDPCKNTQTQPVIDLDVVSHWLGMRKDNLYITVRQSYKRDFDYIERPYPAVPKRHGGQLKKQVLLTPDCFKRLCMRSRSRKAEDVRTYFISLEALVFKYRTQLMEGMRSDMQRIERAATAKTLRKRGPPRAGYIYVLRASERQDSVYKIGRSVDLARRLREHGASKADELDVVFVLRTEDVVAVEGCVKALIRDRRFRKYKEVYQADLDMIKGIIEGCDTMAQTKMHYRAPKPSRLTGGHYIAVIPDAKP
jgi:predicted GIY-YIG superfamily endonuclease